MDTDDYGLFVVIRGHPRESVASAEFTIKTPRHKEQWRAFLCASAPPW